MKQDCDKQRNLTVPAYALFAEIIDRSVDKLAYVERFKFYETAKDAFVVIQTNDQSLYANCIIYKGVI